jgi:hypothetical protein
MDFDFDFDIDFNLEDDIKRAVIPLTQQEIKTILSTNNYNLTPSQLSQVGNYIIAKKDFKTFIRYVFPIIENQELNIYPIINDIINEYQLLLEQKTKRLCINMPPRSGKSMGARYFIIFACLCYKSNYIYTSRNTELLKEFAENIKNILTNDTFFNLFNLKEIKTSEEKTRFENDDWQKIYKNQKITNKKITFLDCNIYLMPIGATTGFGCGVKEIMGFSGGLVCDDPNSLVDTFINQKENAKIKSYFSGILLSRLQGQAFILVIQQRISIFDFTAFLMEKYNNFKFVIKSLIVNGNLQGSPNEYTSERLQELQLNNEDWQAQYQQNPIANIDNMPFNDCPVSNYNNERDFVAWFDPAGQGKDYTAIALIKRVGAFIQVIGYMWRKDWKFCIKDLMEIDKSFNITRLIVETNMTGTIIIDNLLELGIECRGYQTKANKIMKILAMQSYSQNICLIDTGGQANKDFNNNILNWSRQAKFDDGIDSVASFLLYSGLTHL